MEAYRPMIAEELDSREDTMIVLLRIKGITLDQLRAILGATDVERAPLSPVVHYKESSRDGNEYAVDLRLETHTRVPGTEGGDCQGRPHDRTSVGELWDLLGVFPKANAQAHGDAKVLMGNIEGLVNEGKRILDGLRETPGFVQGDPERLFGQLLDRIRAEAGLAKNTLG